MTNNEYPIIFCNPYSIAKTILSSTRNEQLKRLSVWTDHKRYIKKKENEALSDLMVILGNLGFNPYEGWLVKENGLNSLELVSDKAVTLKLNFAENKIRAINNNNEYIYYIDSKKIIKKKTKIANDKAFEFIYNSQKLVSQISLYLINNRYLQINFINGYEENILENIINELFASQSIFDVYTVLKEKLDCSDADIIYYDNHLNISNGKVSYLLTNNNDFQVIYAKDGWEVSSSLGKLELYNQEQSLDEAYEQLEQSKDALSLVRKKFEDIMKEVK